MNKTALNADYAPKKIRNYGIFKIVLHILGAIGFTGVIAFLVGCSLLYEKTGGV